MIDRWIYSHENLFAYSVGVAGGLWNVVLLQTLPTEALLNLKDPVAYASLIALSGVMVTVFTTRSVAALNKLAELPTKEEILGAIDKLGKKVDEKHQNLFDEIRGVSDRVLVLETREEVENANHSPLHS